MQTDKNSVLSQDIEMAFSNVMTGAYYVELDPMFCVPYLMIRESLYSNVPRSVSVFTVQGSSRLVTTAGGIACSTSTAMIVEMIESKPHFVSAYYRGKGISESSTKTKPCGSTK